MKKILLLFTLLFSTGIYAQNGFDFSVDTDTYQDLSNPTSLNNGEVWNDPAYTIPIGFDFEFAGQAYNTIYFPDFGVGDYLSFNQTFEQNIPVSLIVPISSDLIDLGDGTQTSLSPLSYKTTGQEGNHILKVEWNTAGFLGDDTQTDYVNFQIWFYESSNIIEYHYGPSSIDHPMDDFEGESGPNASLVPGIILNSEELTETAYILSGNPSNPTVTEIEPGDSPNPDDGLYLNGYIPNGTVYRFTPSELSTKDFDKTDFVVYPNPTTDLLTVQTTATITQITVYNSLGQKIKSLEKPTKKAIGVSQLQNGVYFIKITTGKTSVTKKFIKN